MFRRIKVRLKWYKRNLKRRWKTFKCITLDWHTPCDLFAFDGCSYVSKCKDCDTKILMDSNGGWFRATSQETKVS